MKTFKDDALWPLGVVLGLWLFVVVQAVGIWLQPHQPAAVVDACAHLQLAQRAR